MGKTKGLENLEVLEDEFNKYALKCEGASKIILSHIELLERMPRFVKLYRRTKTFESVVEKCGRKGYNLDIDTIKSKIKDVAGIRIVTPYLDEIEPIAEEVKKIPGIMVSSQKDYVVRPKDNGYRSLHLNVTMGVYSSIDGTSPCPVEIQIRTRTMDMWAGLEHILNYKNPDSTPESKKLFGEMAKTLAKFEEKVMYIRDFNEQQETRSE